MKREAALCRLTVLLQIPLCSHVSSGATPSPQVVPKAMPNPERHVVGRTQYQSLIAVEAVTTKGGKIKCVTPLSL